MNNADSAFRIGNELNPDRLVERRRPAMYGGDPYEDDVERLPPADPSSAAGTGSPAGGANRG